MKKVIAAILFIACLTFTIPADSPQRTYSAFRRDGNLVVTTETTEGGPLRYVSNAGFLIEPNHSMIFCSDIAKAMGIPTCLWHNQTREQLYSEILWTISVQPTFDHVQALDAMSLASWGIGKLPYIANALDAFKMNYWENTNVIATLHNLVASNLRYINPRTINGIAVELTNLNSAARVLDRVSVGIKVSAAAIGALIQASFYSDMALVRLSILDDLLVSYPDPTIRAACSQVRSELTKGDTYWEAFLIEIEKQKDVFIKLGFDMGLKAVFKALGIKGSLGVLLVFETIQSDWKQHSDAQWAVLIATLEEALSNAAARESNDPIKCELERMATTARFLYFDRMNKVTSAWQGALRDLLTIGSNPYAEAKEYYRDQRDVQLLLVERARQNSCWIPVDIGVQSFRTGGEAVLVIDSSGSMADNDPRRLRIQAAQMLAGRIISDRAISVVNFDEQAKILISHEFRQDPINTAISGIGANGRTCIPRGLEAAASALRASGGGGMVILFTDGQNTACQGDAPAWFSENRIPIFVIGLSDAVNEAYLQRMAYSTGGEYMKARGATDLPGIFDWIGTMAGMEDLVEEVSGKITQGEINAFQFPVDSLAERLVCRVWYPGSRMVLDLIAPDGKVIDKNSQFVKDLVGATYELIEVENPQPGNWMAKLAAVETVPEGEPFNIRVGMKTSSPISVETITPIEPDETYKFALKYDVTKISAKNYEGKVLYPNGTSGILEQSSAAGHWEVQKPVFGGVHQYFFFIEGNDSKGMPLKRIAQKSIFYDGPQMPINPILTKIEGAIGTINMGQNFGLRPGMRIEIRKGTTLVGFGYILSVFYDFSQVEFVEPRGRTWRVGDEAVPIRNIER